MPKIVSNLEPKRMVSAVVLAATGLIVLCGTSLANADETVTEFTRNVCVECHSGPDAEAGFRVDTLVDSYDLLSPKEVTTAEDYGLSNSAFDAWVMIHQRVSKGEMPPRDAEQPDNGARTQFLATLGESLADVDRKHQQRPELGPAVVDEVEVLEGVGVALAEAFLLVFLLVEGLHHADSGHGVGDHVVE